MRPHLVIERQVPPHALMGGADAVIGPQIHLLVLHTPPQPFDKHVVPPAAGAVHADLDAMVFQQSRELLAGELGGWLGSLLDFAPLHRHALLWCEGRRLNRVLNLRNA